MEPTHPVFGELFDPRFQLRLVEFEVVYRPDPGDTHSRETGTTPVHQGPANRAEVVSHRVTGSNGLVLRVTGQFVLAADVFGGGLFDDEVGGED